MGNKLDRNTIIAWLKSPAGIIVSAGVLGALVVLAILNIKAVVAALVFVFTGGSVVLWGKKGGVAGSGGRGAAGPTSRGGVSRREEIQQERREVREANRDAGAVVDRLEEDRKVLAAGTGSPGKVPTPRAEVARDEKIDELIARHNARKAEQQRSRGGAGTGGKP